MTQGLGEKGRLLMAAESGDLWFATRKGLALTKPMHLQLNPVAPSVLVQHFMVDDTEQPLTAGLLQLPSGHRSFTFDYAALSYTMPSRFTAAISSRASTGTGSMWERGGRRTTRACPDAVTVSA